MTPVVVRASVRARLLGLPILRLDADVAIAPVAAPRGPAALPGPVAPGDLRTARELLTHATDTLARADHVR